MNSDISFVEKYKKAVEYMARTELYDRTMTELRAPHDPTEAYIMGKQRKYSYRYAQQVLKELGIKYTDIEDIIQIYRVYSAQHWIDEWYRLKGGNEEKNL